LSCLVVAGSIAAAHADSVGARVTLLPKYQQECAACHMAYPPGMLPAASWQRLMGSLEKHFGTDASLDEASVREIGGWLKTNAGTHRRVSEAPPQDRITRSAWFLRQHDEVPAAVWKRQSIRSASNCAACHGGAEQGRFNEDDVRIPR
jgi:mono/diheme cytochrome c family protein